MDEILCWVKECRVILDRFYAVADHPTNDRLPNGDHFDTVGYAMLDHMDKLDKLADGITNRDVRDAIRDVRESERRWPDERDLDELERTCREASATE